MPSEVKCHWAEMSSRAQVVESLALVDVIIDFGGYFMVLLFVRVKLNAGSVQDEFILKVCEATIQVLRFEHSGKTDFAARVREVYLVYSFPDRQRRIFQCSICLSDEYFPVGGVYAVRYVGNHKFSVGETCEGWVARNYFLGVFFDLKLQL